MKNKPKNQSGFSVLIIVLIILVCALVAGVGYKVYTASKSGKNNSSSNDTTATKKIETELYAFNDESSISIDSSVDNSGTTSGRDYYKIGSAGRIVITKANINTYINDGVIFSASDPELSSKVNDKIVKTVLNPACINPKTIDVSGASNTVQLRAGTTESSGCYLLTAVNKNGIALSLYVNYSPTNTSVSKIAKSVADSFTIK